MLSLRASRVESEEEYESENQQLPINAEVSSTQR